MKKFNKIFCFVFVFIFVFAQFVPMISAAATSNPMENTYVMDDLNAMNVNLSQYPRDTSDKGAHIISFMEYGYSAVRDFRYYGLYLYLYIPKGVMILPTKNYLEMSYMRSDNSTSSVVKYPLEVLSYSEDGNRDYVFYKLKVGVGPLFASNLNPNCRTYNLTSLELNFSDTGIESICLYDKNNKDIKNSYEYRGYQKYFGDTEDRNDLHCTKTTTEVCQVEIGTGSWFSDTSVHGEDYRWEVSSVYFAIPNYFINKYGDLDSETSGLVKVEGVYDKYGINGLIAPDQTWYDRFEPLAASYLFPDSYLSDRPSFYKLFSSSTSYEGETATIEWLYYYSFNLQQSYNAGPVTIYNKSRHTLEQLCLVSQGTSSNISSLELKMLYDSFNRPKIKNSSKMFIGKKLNNIGEVQYPYTVTVDGDLSSSLKTYAARKEWGSLNWLHQLFNKDFYTDKDGYIDCKALVELDSVDFSDKILESNYIGSELYLQWSDYLDLKDYYNDNAFGNHVYLMRFDVNPYYCSTVTLEDSTKGTGFYYEKVIYENFDILNFTFQNKSGSLVTVPVSSKPVDLIGSIVSGSNKDDNNPNLYPVDDTITAIRDWAFETLGSLNDLSFLIVMVLGLFVFVVIGSLLFNWLSPIVGPFLLWIGGLFGKIFGSFGKIIGGFFRGIGNIFRIIWNGAASIANIFLPFNLPTSRGGGRDYYTVKQDKIDNARKDQELAIKMAADQHAERLERRKEALQKKNNNKSYDTDDFFDAAVKKSYEDFSKLP